MKKLLALTLTAFLACAGNAVAQAPNAGGAMVPTNPGFQGLPASYVSGSWYQPDHGLVVTGGAAVSVNTIVCVFGAVRAPVTIKNFQAKVTTLSAGNMQFGLYSVSGGTLTLVDSTANVSTGGTGNITGAPALTTDALSPSVLYAWCTNFNATPVLSSFAATSNGANAIIGSATQANTVGGASLVVGKSVAQTFGTWPSSIALSGMSDITTTVLPQVGFQVN